jgi:Fe-S cluster assembly iron-binding protein IscA
MHSLVVTDAALQALEKLRADSKLNRPVASVFRARDTQGRDLGWLVGAYAREKVAHEPLVTIRGVEFYIEDDRWPELTGKTLDFVNGRFTVT